VVVVNTWWRMRLPIEGNLDYAHLADVEELYDVEDGTMDYYSGTEYGEEDLW
jgi:hypothetical protein